MAGLELTKMRLNLLFSLRDTFPGENTAVLADILSLAAERGRIY